jgi:hypothetical protein
MDGPNGLVGQMVAAAGKREELVGYMLERTREMPGETGSE